MNGFSRGTQTDSNFKITSSNNEINFTDDGGSNYDTASIATGTYSGNNLANEVKNALDSASSVETYTVNYNEGNDKFTVSANGDDSGDDQFLWTDGASTASDILGYAQDSDPSDGVSDTSGNAVAFNIITDNNDDINIEIDGDGGNEYTVNPGVYDGSGLASEIQNQISGATVSFDSDNGDFVITSDTSTLSDTPSSSSISVSSGNNDLASFIGYGGGQSGTNGNLAITEGSNDKFDIRIDGESTATTVDFTGDDVYSDADNLVSDINNNLPSGATASWDTDHIVIKSESNGLDSEIVVTSASSNDGASAIGLDSPTERTGDAVVEDPNDVLTSESTTGSELGSADSIKYVDGGGSNNNAFDSSEPVVEDNYDNGIYGDMLQSTTITNDGSFTGSIEDISLYRETGSEGFDPSGSNTEEGDTAVSSFDSSIESINIADAGTGETFYVAVDIPNNVEAGQDGNDIQADMSSVSTSATANTPSAGGQDGTAQIVNAPHITETVTADSNDDGNVDQVTVKFSESVNLNDGSGNGIPGISFSSIGTIADSDYSVSSNEVDVDLTSDSQGDSNTGDTATPSYDSSAGNINTSSYELTESMSQNTETDGAVPQIIDFKYKDSDNNGKVNKLDVKFSESLDGSSTLAADDLAFSDVGDFTGASISSGSNPSGQTSTYDLSGAPVDTHDDSGNLQVNVSSGDMDLKDENSNSNTERGLSATDQASYTDGAPPVKVTGAYLDENEDNNVDTVEVQMSEAVEDSTFDNSQGEFKVSSLGSGTATANDYNLVNGNSVQTVSDTKDDNTIYIDLETDAGSDTTVYSSAQIDSSGLPTGLIEALSNGQGNDQEADTTSLSDKADPVVDVDQGLNFVSFPVADTRDLQPEDVMPKGKLNEVWKYESSGEFDVWTPNKDDNGKDMSIESGEGYIVDASQSFQVSNDIDSMTTPSLPSKKISEGYNLVGHFDEDQEAAGSAFTAISSNVADKIFSFTGSGQTVSFSSTILDSTTMKPGRAYWVKSNSDLSDGSLTWTEN